MESINLCFFDLEECNGFKLLQLLSLVITSIFIHYTEQTIMHHKSINKMLRGVNGPMSTDRLL